MLNPNDLLLMQELVGSSTPIQLMLDRFLNHLQENGHIGEPLTEYARAGYLIGAVEAYNMVLGASRLDDSGQAMATITANMKADFDRLLA